MSTVGNEGEILHPPFAIQPMMGKLYSLPLKLAGTVATTLRRRFERTGLKCALREF